MVSAAPGLCRFVGLESAFSRRAAYFKTSSYVCGILKKGIHEKRKPGCSYKAVVWDEQFVLFLCSNRVTWQSVACPCPTEEQMGPRPGCPCCRRGQAQDSLSSLFPAPARPQVHDFNLLGGSSHARMAVTPRAPVTRKAAQALEQILSQSRESRSFLPKGP